MAARLAKLKAEQLSHASSLASRLKEQTPTPHKVADDSSKGKGTMDGPDLKDWTEDTDVVMERMVDQVKTPEQMEQAASNISQQIKQLQEQMLEEKHSLAEKSMTLKDAEALAQVMARSNKNSDASLAVLLGVIPDASDVDNSMVAPGDDGDDDPSDDSDSSSAYDSYDSDAEKSARRTTKRLSKEMKRMKGHA